MIWLIVLIPLILFILGYWAHRHPSQATSREPLCGQCGYVVIGLPSSICPECGHDLREVGIRYPPAVRERVTRAGLLILWTILLLACGVASYGWLSARLPNYRRYYTTLELELAEPEPAPDEPLVVRLNRRAKIDGAGHRPAVGAASIEIVSPQAGASVFVVWFPEMSWRYSARKTEREGTAYDLKPAVLLDWMHSAGVDTGRTGLTPAVEDLLAQMDLWHLWRQASTYNTTSWRIPTEVTREGWSDHEILKWGTWVFWVLVGLVGILRYRRQERRRRQDLADVHVERQGESHLGESAT